MIKSAIPSDPRNLLDWLSEIWLKVYKAYLNRVTRTVVYETKPPVQDQIKKYSLNS